MELVYLWVEDYKNIQKQGFNFSPRFECKFHDEYDEDGKLKDNCKLDIIEKKEDEYIKEFFGKNINITAIVGKNGSGKSSVLDKIILAINSNENIFLILKIEKKYYVAGCKSLLENLKINSLFQIEKEFDYKLISMLFLETENNCPPVREDMLHFLKFPSYLDEFTDSVYIDEYSSRPNEIVSSPQYIGKKLLKLIQYNHIFIDVFFDFKVYGMYVLPNDEYLYNLKYQTSDILEFSPYSEKYNFVIDDVFSLFILTIFSNIKMEEVFFNECVYRKDKNYIVDYKRAYAILAENNIEVNITFDEYSEFDELLSKCDGELEIENIPLIKNIFFDFFNFYIRDEKGRYFNDLSYGEKSVIAHFVSIYERIVFSKKNNFLIVLDEADISLHPSWQKKYFSKLLSILSKLNKNICIVISSHSPFLLSDIPKQNIIFLDKDEKGNCKVVNGLKEKKQTFGANIHTLLSDSFFMEDGLMGEFAKNKINKIIRFLNGKNKFIDFPIEQIEKVINTIGEPFLKEKLLKMYDKKYPKTNEEKIAELQKQIDELR